MDQSYSLQIMTLLSVNILARWCRDITVQIPDHVVSIIPRYLNQDLSEILRLEYSQIDPYGQISIDSVDPAIVDDVLSIGCSNGAKSSN